MTVDDMNAPIRSPGEIEIMRYDDDGARMCAIDFFVNQVPENLLDLVA